MIQNTELCNFVLLLLKHKIVYYEKNPNLDFIDVFFYYSKC